MARGRKPKEKFEDMDERELLEIEEGSFIDDNIRSVNLIQNPNAGYTPQEIMFIEAGMKKKSEDFTLSTDSDNFLAWRAVICELKIKQLEIMKMNQPIKQWESTQKQIELLDKQYKSFLDSLNGLKKQRDNIKDKPDEESENWFLAIESVDKLEIEARKQEREILAQMKKREKRNKS